MSGPDGLKGSVLRVKATLSAFGLDNRILEFDSTTRTSAEAAGAIGCAIGQIAKTLVFRGKPSGQAIIVIASGSNRVDENKLESHLGEKVAKADADFVREKTGFAIGGVAPIGHIGPVTVLIDSDLCRFSEIWAAAGSPNAVFRLTPADLTRITEGSIVDLILDRV